ncbi:helix-turn-helix transcriptional regulator [Leisingera sp. HS039]|nr:XRE family transcriptional regulator [Leisingera sp. HS039]MBQ4825726.1 helix-turn-helix transcriptional regulator [Leisingera sp. HS039]QAX27953.1 XRE family transcriptional regulator [Leisingera sp. NJS204]QBR38501.1 XRE family transcriptional regulator [Leisingera sp. NJS201]
MIAAAIQRERSRAGMSLSGLAAQAGIAKSTLSQLEAGNGNPSVETLWALAAALDVPLSLLFETEAPATKLIRASEGEVLESEQSDFAAVLLSRSPPNVRRDVYRVVMQPGEIRRAAPHPRGTVEHMLVCSGQMRAGLEGQEELLWPGDYYSFPGDHPHSYEATRSGTLFLMVMEAP